MFWVEEAQVQQHGGKGIWETSGPLLWVEQEENDEREARKVGRKWSKEWPHMPNQDTEF